VADGGEPVGELAGDLDLQFEQILSTVIKELVLHRGVACAATLHLANIVRHDVVERHLERERRSLWGEVLHVEEDCTTGLHLSAGAPACCL
jgi:hypothetical protein